MSIDKLREAAREVVTFWLQTGFVDTSRMTTLQAAISNALPPPSPAVAEVPALPPDGSKWVYEAGNCSYEMRGGVLVITGTSSGVYTHPCDSGEFRRSEDIISAIADGRLKPFPTPPAPESVPTAKEVAERIMVWIKTTPGWDVPGVARIITADRDRLARRVAELEDKIADGCQAVLKQGEKLNEKQATIADLRDKVTELEKESEYRRTMWMQTKDERNGLTAKLAAAGGGDVAAIRKRWCEIDGIPGLCVTYRGDTQIHLLPEMYHAALRQAGGGE